MPPFSRDVSSLKALVVAFVCGTFVGSYLLHILMAIVTPQPRSALEVLSSPAFLVFAPLVGLFAVIPFILGAMIGWRYRRVTVTSAKTALIACAAVGAAAGFITSRAFGLEIGPGGFWSGPMIGTTFGIALFFGIRFALRERSNA